MFVKKHATHLLDVRDDQGYHKTKALWIQFISMPKRKWLLLYHLRLHIVFLIRFRLTRCLTMLLALYHGRRKGGRGAWSPLDFEIFRKKGCFRRFEWKKTSFTTFGPPWKKSFRRPCTLRSVPAVVFMRFQAHSLAVLIQLHFFLVSFAYLFSYSLYSLNATYWCICFAKDYDDDFRRNRLYFWKNREMTWYWLLTSWKPYSFLMSRSIVLSPLLLGYTSATVKS